MVNEKYFIKNSKHIREILNKELIEKRKQIEYLSEDIKHIKMTRDLLKKGSTMARDNLEVKNILKELFYK